MPMPGAIASGIFARKHIMKQPIALEMQVAATRDCFTWRLHARKPGSSSKTHPG